jgi:hypothetical protein
MPTKRQAAKPTSLGTPGAKALKQARKTAAAPSKTTEKRQVLKRLNTKMTNAANSSTATSPGA